METPMEQMQEVVQTNLVGALLCSRAAWQVVSKTPVQYAVSVICRMYLQEHTDRKG